jgi:hypothetical protein
MMPVTSPARVVGFDYGTRKMSDPDNARPNAALDTWFATVYDQLRGLARQRLSNERADHTLQPTALVNEVFLRLQQDEAARSSRGSYLDFVEQARRRAGR